MSASLPPSRTLWPGVANMGLRLDELVRELGPSNAHIEGDASVRFYGVRHDSRQIEGGDLFFARRGQKSDGAKFARDAVKKGARAVLAGEGVVDAKDLGVPVIVAKDPVAAFAHAADAVYGHPSFTLDVVGVTGTNGKTTVTHLVRDAIDGALGLPQTGLVGTLGHRFKDFRLEAEHTTPEADEIARAMAAFREKGAHYVAMEVSSIALSLNRVKAVRFRVAVFTNLTQDHLDFHGDMGAYAEAKGLLFDALGPAAAVVNVDDPFGRVLAGRVRAPLLKVSARVESEADVAPIAVVFGEEGITARVRTPAGEVDLRSRLVGQHNLENLLVALAVAHALELDVQRAAVALSASPGAPGRLERCDEEGDDIRVLVDYAHTPDAIVKAIAAVRSTARGRIVAVFGCGGDRDPTKREPMGRAAAAADVVVVTSDNPRTEDPAKIAAAAEAGVIAAGHRDHRVELDRRLAIERAILDAAPGDTVLILGKGHETYQIIGIASMPFDDGAVAREALASRRERG